MSRAPRTVPFLLSLALAASAACSSDDAAGSGPSVERSVSVAAVEMVPRDMSLELRVSGNIEPIREVRMSSRMSGIVSQVAVEEGDWVERGAVLARIDVAEQRAELSRARANLEQAETAYQRARQLREQDLVSTAEYEDARAAASVARSEVELWETRARFGTVAAPSPGRVTRKMVEAGSAVANGEDLFVIADVSTLVVRVGITDIYAPRLSPGDRVAVQVDAIPDRTWEATIRRIFPSADPESRLIPVEIAFVDPDRELLRPGFLARIRLDVERLPDVLAVPNESLLASTRDDPFVYVIDEDDRLVRRTVETGVSRRDWTEIRSGLERGEMVVASNPANLSEGTLVRVSDRISHASEGGAR